jgi:hypothetical protein
MRPAAPLEIHHFIDQLPLSRYQLLIAILCAMVLFMDGFDAQAMGFVAPALMDHLHIARASLGPVFSSGLVGIMIGANRCSCSAPFCSALARCSQPLPSRSHRCSSIA